MALQRPLWGLTDGAEHVGRLRKILAELAAWGSAREWMGPDPYEGLNTPLAVLARHSKLGRQAVIQAYRRSSIRPPWPLRAPVRPNSKALGLILSAYSTTAGSALPEAKARVPRLGSQLEQLRIPGADAWGYHFDVQTRHLYYDTRTPNAIATCFVIRGLLDGHEHGVLAAGANAALRARPFLESLWNADSDLGPYFGYIADGSELIHNANVMVCGTLARLDRLDPEPGIEAKVAAAVDTTVVHRREDGLWPYGERDDLTWRDNFHTAYILEGLARMEADTPRHGELLSSATAAWLEAFFDPTGAASYHPDRAHPVDAHSAASAVDALCVLASLGREWASLTDVAAAVATRATETLWLADEGRFANQRTARRLNRREFMRWTNAPMFEALARVLSVTPLARG